MVPMITGLTVSLLNKICDQGFSIKYKCHEKVNKEYYRSIYIRGILLIGHEEKESNS